MTDSRILHIATDEKFIDAGHYLFEKAFPGLNTFVIIKPPANPPTQYVSSKVQARFVISSTEAVKTMAEISANYSVTVLHGLNEFNAAVYFDSTVKERFMTIIFGAEIYNSASIIGEKLIGSKSEKLCQSIQKKTIVDYLKEVYRKIAYRSHTDFDHVEKSSILYNMRGFGSLPSYSYQKLIDKNIYRPTVKKVPFSYYPIEFVIKDPKLMSKGNDILLGNSASATNNHLEALDLLKELDLNGRTIYTPLSYGNPRYCKAIVAYGSKLFPDSFEPLTTFLPLKEYNKVISQCGIVIMNHYRPQAMGNIIASLYMGCKVFLNNTDAYQYFKALGCNIYLIEDHLMRQHEAFQLLTEDQIKQNRMVLKNELSTNKLVEGMRKSFEKVYDFDAEGSPKPNFNLN